ncbi:FtsK/SpoIIIE domain-containing protein [Streptacidiphilus sp. MAP5-3]|uniref:FtsK/SpoIIIE domain-containing protein n=1 Tax=unclassified Streptacidiphilus TaxID=2643834 RepID=UPI00351924BA
MGWARWFRPAVFWALVGLPLVLARVAFTYYATMDVCGLTVPPTRWQIWLQRAVSPEREIRPVPPKIRRIRPTATGLRLRLRLAPGQEPADVAAASERLRHTWGVHGVHVRPIKPGVIELRLVGYDVLRRVAMPRKTPAAEALRIPIALRDDATVFMRDYRVSPHAMTLGATLSGKSVYLRNLITGLARQRVALVGIDCKRGVEQAPFAPRLSALATDQDQAAELLPLLVAEMEARYDLIRARQGIAPGVAAEEIAADIWDLPEKIRPVPIVLLVDEVAELFLVATAKDEKRRDQMVTDLIRLAQLGRAAGMFMEICGQRFGSELGKGATMLRAQLTGRVVHRVNDVETARMGLGDVAPEATAAACEIRPDRPGLAVVGDTSGGWSRIRTPLLTMRDAVTVCRQFAHLTPELPALARFRPFVPAPADAPADLPPLIRPLPVAE